MTRVDGLVCTLICAACATFLTHGFPLLARKVDERAAPDDYTAKIQWLIAIVSMAALGVIAFSLLIFLWVTNN